MDFAISQQTGAMVTAESFVLVSSLTHCFLVVLLYNSKVPYRRGHLKEITGDAFHL